MIEGIVGYVIEDSGDKVYVTCERGDRLYFPELAPKVNNPEELRDTRTPFTIMCLSESAEVLQLSLEELEYIRDLDKPLFDSLFESMEYMGQKLRHIRIKVNDEIDYMIGTGTGKKAKTRDEKVRTNSLNNRILSHHLTSYQSLLEDT